MGTKLTVKVMKELLNTAKDGEAEILSLIVESIYTSKNCESETDLSWLLICDKKGRTLLHLASMHGHVNVLNYIWKEILESTTSKKLRKQYIDMKDNKGRTSLFYASSRGYDDVVSYLINRDANLETSTNENHIAPGSTALMASAERNTVKCFELILDAKANIHTQRRNRADALYMAARYGNHEIIRHLAINDYLNPIINRGTFHGRTAILTASLNGHLGACKELFKNGANINYQDNDKLTPLILATNEGHVLVVRWLIQNGADIYRKDKHRGSALDAALANGYGEIVNFLIKSQHIIENGGDIDDLTHIEKDIKQTKSPPASPPPEFGASTLAFL